MPEPSESEVILSLGGGVQSTTLALMALRGDLPPEFRRPRAAVFADTGFEPARVYAHLRWLIHTLGQALPVYVVRAMRPDGTPAHIREDSEAIVRGELTRLANPPLFVKESVQYTPYPYAQQQARFEAYLIRRGQIPRFVTMPVFAREFTGSKPVMLRRQCTGDYKIVPIYQFCKSLLGRRRGQRHNTPPFCEMWIGISADENPKRCKPAQEAWVANRHPLRELRMTRADCATWLWNNYHIVVPKSACLGCLSYETEVITPNGARPIGSLVGRATLLVPKRQSHWGTWQEVEVRSFGIQRLFKITLARRRVRKVIHATTEHRWVTKARNGCWQPFITTLDLQPGDVIPSCCYTSILASKHAVTLSPFGIAHGFVFGNNSIPRQRSYSAAAVEFHGTKDLAMLRSFALCEPREYALPHGGPTLRVMNLPRRWKKPPPLDEARGYLLRWLAGYFAAGGHVTARGQATLSSASLENLAFVRDLCYVLGVRTSPVGARDHPATGGLARLYSLTLCARDLPDSFWLIPHHLQRIQDRRAEAEGRIDDWTVLSVEATEREEEVFCAVVPGTEMFTLADNVVTGNCPFHDDNYWRELREQSPDEFEEACRFDETIRHLPGVRGECFLHSSCVPLREIDFSRTRGERRALARGQALLFDGCEGVCSL